MTNIKDMPLVSVIIPMYNAEQFIQETIQSVLAQTYQVFEIIVVDDQSSDNSMETVRSLIAKDSRIRLLQNEVNSGVAVARNAGVAEANGRFICFLDADDLWLSDKLAKQVSFMLENSYAFSFTSYQFADENGLPIKSPVHVPGRLSYKEALRKHTIWTSTVMLDLEQLTKQQIEMPNVRRGQDTATWWKILKVTDYAYSIDEVLSLYRRTSDSLSANKLSAIKRTWNLFRNVEGLSFWETILPFCGYAYNAIKRRI
ncbi:glycosyltransferase family 2 protein [Streptococcus suis]|uniref:glycosyltransferase family 2 protein n=1 Tax=Streptococcus suis TaxID=1307 RepID=UPI001ABED81A|nr:glycosyltransferase family 2 protein [Streptococcus suis]